MKNYSMGFHRFYVNFQKRLVSKVRRSRTLIVASNQYKLGFLSHNFYRPQLSDRVLCHFCFKPKKVTEAVLGFDNTRRSQNMISSIILLKTALDALPLLAMVFFSFSFCYQICLLDLATMSMIDSWP